MRKGVKETDVGSYNFKAQVRTNIAVTVTRAIH